MLEASQQFRRTLGQFCRHRPEFFPAAFAPGYSLEHQRSSARLGLRLRRVGCKAAGAVFTARPSFVLPYLT